MGLDHIDLIYSEVPPDGVGLADAIDMITGLIRAGAARAWGTLNWTPAQMERAWQIADREGVPVRWRRRPRTAWCAGRSWTIRRCAALAADLGVASWRPTRWRVAS